MTFWAYLLRCADSSYYTGDTDNLEKRLAEHELGTFDGYTKSRRPLVLVYCEDYPTRDEAFFRERQIKGWSRAKKEALIAQRWEELVRLSKSQVKLRAWLGELGLST